MIGKGLATIGVWGGVAALAWICAAHNLLSGPGLGLLIAGAVFVSLYIWRQ